MTFKAALDARSHKILLNPDIWSGSRPPEAVHSAIQGEVLELRDLYVVLVS